MKDFAITIKFTKVGKILIGQYNHPSISGNEAAEFCKEIKTKISKGHTQIIINLRGTTFVDSTGIGVFFSIFRSINGVGELVFTNLSDPIKASFNLTKLVKLFHIVENVEDAISYLESLEKK